MTLGRKDFSVTRTDGGASPCAATNSTSIGPGSPLLRGKRIYLHMVRRSPGPCRRCSSSDAASRFRAPLQRHL